MVGLEDIQKALNNIRPHVHKTPLIYSNSFSKMTGAEVFIKAENLQKTGSFKVRGAFNRMISMTEDKVIAASMGNHAQGVAFAADRLGKQAKIVMPENSPLSKQEATRGYGAEVVLYGQNFREAMDYARSQRGYVLIPTFDDDDIIAGQGTIGLEILDDIQDVNSVLVPVGGGGLISGISAGVKALSPATEVIGIQSDSAPSAHTSFKNNKLTRVPPLPTVADGIAIGQVGDRTFELIRNNVDDFLLVNEDAIAMAILLFLERKKLVVEGAGAVPLAALIENRERFRGKRVVLIVSGGNIDFTVIDRIIHKGLVTGKRIGLFEVTASDIPGSLHALTGIISSSRANIINVVHDRLAEDLSVGKTRIIFTVEIRGEGHLEEILSDLSAQGYEVKRTKH